MIAATSGADLVLAWMAVATVVVYVIVAVVAVGQLRDARELRREETRPYVYVDFEISDGQVIELLIQNVGRTAALDVHFNAAFKFLARPRTTGSKLNLREDMADAAARQVDEDVIRHSKTSV